MAMLLLVLGVVLGGGLGLSGRIRVFAIGFGLVSLLLGGALLYDYIVYVLPSFADGDSDDGAGFGFGFAIAFQGFVLIATLAAFCFGLLVNALFRWMNWL